MNITLKKAIIILGMCHYFPFSHTLNISKLNKQNINIINKTNQQQELLISKLDTCSLCQDTQKTNTKITLEQQEQITIHSTNRIKRVSSIHKNAFLTMKNNNDLIIKSNKHQSIASLSALADEKDTFSFQPDIINYTHAWCGYLLPENVSPEGFFSFINKQYRQNAIATLLATKSPQEHLKIPNIIHQIWFGITGEIPPLYKKWQKNWRKQHPSWRFICWNKDLLFQHFPEGLFNQKTFSAGEEIRNYAKMADVARYEIIEKFGGLYIDIDTENYESVEPLHYLYDFYTSNESDNFLLVCNCLFAAKPHHPIMKECLHLIKHYEEVGLPKKLYMPPLAHHSHGLGRFTLYHTGPGVITQAAWKTLNTDNNTDIIFPSTYLCPRKKPSYLSLCAHHFECPAKKKNQTWGDILITANHNK